MATPLLSVTAGPDVKRAAWSIVSARRPPRRVLLVLWLAILVLWMAILVMLGWLMPLTTTLRPHVQASSWLASRGSQGMARVRAFHVGARYVPRRHIKEFVQVAQPVLGPGGVIDSDGTVDEAASKGDSRELCTVVLMEHSFQNSYGKPFVGNYTPPSCDFSRVVMNFTVVSQGKQFDRLAVMYLDDTEVWRTSTAEPARAPGIRWTYMKDMTPYLSLWKSPQKVIFGLGNIIDGNYTAAYNATLTATFFNSQVEVDTAPPSHLIIPISGRRSANLSTSEFTLPEQEATNVIDFPRNARRAVFSISACGQADEEFWWSNVLQSDVYTFNDTMGQVPGYSPFREVQLEIDGQLAGVQWPFPVIFTGGVTPSLHRPIVGVDAFDLEEHVIDITPFLPVLCDGEKHNFTMRVAGLDDDGGTTATLTKTVGSNWVVTGKIFVWLDDKGSITTGDKPTIQAMAPSTAVSQRIAKFPNGTNTTLDYTTSVARTFLVSGRVTTQNGTSVTSWFQNLSYTNIGAALDQGSTSFNNFTTRGMDTAARGGAGYFSTSYMYPLFANATVNMTAGGDLTLTGHLVQGKRTLVSGASVFPTGLEPFAAGGALAKTAGERFSAALMATTKEGKAWLFLPASSAKATDIRGTGSGSQLFLFGGMNTTGAGAEAGAEAEAQGTVPDVELYKRNITITRGQVVDDRVTLAGELVREREGLPGPDIGGPFG